METVLELRALTKKFPTHLAVNNISFSIERGEIFSLVGPSGCGKTTTLRLIAGFDEPTSGEIFLGGKAVAGLRPHERNVTTVFQNYALFPHLNVAENVRFGLERQAKLNGNAITEKVKQTLELVQLSGKEQRFPHQISGGERQRVALARSLVLEPDVLLLDEPLSALDPNLRRQMRVELRNLQRKVGVAFLFITHDRDEALSLSDRMAVMDRGTLEQMGSPKDLYREPASRFVAEFLGEVNWLNGVGVRPESLRIWKTRPGPEVPCIYGVVENSTFLGNCIHVHAKLASGAMCTAEMPRETEFKAGDEVYAWWHAADALPVRKT